MSDRTPRLYVPMLKPRDVIPHLGKGEAHWQAAFSAHALATTWFKANTLPPRVQAILDGHDRFRGAELVDAILERKTDLRDNVRGPSQTDLLAILGIGSALAIAAVEGKVDETFGQLVFEWLGDERPASASKRSKDKQTRLSRLKNVLGLEEPGVLSLRYQLLHRTASAIYEAERYRASTALMLVHSFSAQRSGWTDYSSFVQAIGISENPQPGLILGPKRFAEVELYVGWLADSLPTRNYHFKFENQSLRSRPVGGAAFASALSLLGLQKEMAKCPDLWALHKRLLEGLPDKSVINLRRHLTMLKWDDDLERALGINLRSVERLQESTESRRLTPEESSRLWTFAHILGSATSVLGSQKAAEEWLSTPTRSFAGSKPITLLATTLGIEVVEDFLVQLDTGVYG